MRYTEQIKYSWGYHWGICCEVWDIFTLQNWRWFIVGLWVVLCALPVISSLLTPVIGYYVSTPVPMFFPSLSQELAITDYLSKARPIPSILAVVSYYWFRGSGFNLLVSVLCIATVGFSLVAYLRKEAQRGREGENWELITRTAQTVEANARVGLVERSK